MEKIYKNSLNTLLVVALLLGSWQISAQISFTNSNALLTSSDWHSGVAIGVVDMNNDKLDDILRLSQGKIMTIEYQVPDSMFAPYTYGSISGESQWAMAAGDINNDGYNDVIGGDYNYTKLVVASPDGTSYTHSTLPGPSFFAQGSNFVDINNDGLLDIFACNDNAESRIWSNNGDGTFFEADGLIDMTTTPVSDNSGNYGSLWTDFDNDGDIDLYIAKCRQGVSSSSDPRRINALFVNDGNNNYTERAEDFGLKIGWQSWTSDFNDIDNDGDMDIFITNHDFANMLMENDGSGHFRDISTNQNIGITTTSFPIQGVMRDFDNDGFMDILVSGSQHHLYKNNGDKTFTEITGLFDNNQIESFAFGDLNNDGFVDIYAGYAGIYTNPSNIDDVIWMNDANDNNWFGVDLVGNISNRNAIGARIEIYGSWGVQIRDVRAGESYGITNSFKQSFGLGDDTAIDYVIVKWPSGVIDVIENPNINEYLTIEESSCTPFTIEIAADGNTIICEGQTVGLTAPAGYNYIWNNGNTSAMVEAGNSGNYNVVVEDLTTGCFGISQNIAIQFEPDETPSVAVEGDLDFCVGESVTLTSSEAVSYSWSNGDTTQSVTVTSSGEYFVSTEGLCSANESESFIITVLDADNPVADDVAVLAGPVTLNASGDNPQWYDAEIGGTFLGEGNTIEIPLVEVPTTFWVEDLIEYASPTENTGMEMYEGSNPYASNQTNAGLLFNVMAPVTINSVLVYTDTEGERIIEVRNSSGDVIASKLINIPVTDANGIRVDLGFDVPVGDVYQMTTNTNQNNTVLGFPSPRLQRSQSGVNYPEYQIEDLMEVTGPTVGATRYYYFYDWEIQPSSVYCISDRIPVEVTILTSTYNIEDSRAIQLFPNPTDGQLSLRLDFNQNTEVDLRITDLAGKAVYTQKIGTINGQYTQDLNLAYLAKGIYMVQVVTPEHSYFGKIAIQ
jgi:hypothetical protein